jgi:transcriptional regulator with XRE-family HTH domain
MTNRLDTSRYLLGQNVRTLREAKSYSLRTLARRAGVSHETVRAVERGSSSPTIATIEKIAVGLDTEVRALLPETATVGRRRGPRKRMMMRARVSGTMRDLDGTRWEVVAGQTMLDPEHPIFKANPELRRHFELRDANEDIRVANRRHAERRLGTPSTQPAKRASSDPIQHSGLTERTPGPSLPARGFAGVLDHLLRSASRKGTGQPGPGDAASTSAPLPDTRGGGIDRWLSGFDDVKAGRKVPHFCRLKSVPPQTG